MIKPVNYNFIISNNYLNLCNIFINPLEKFTTEQSFEIDIAKKIIDKIDSNFDLNVIPEITLIGATENTTWEEITKNFITFIRSKNYFYKIIIQCDFLEELTIDKINFCHENQVNLILNINKDNFDETIINNIIQKFPLTTIKYYIFYNDRTNLFKIYEFFNQIKLKNLEFLFEIIPKYDDDINTYTDFFNEIKKIKDFILNTFKNEDIPLIPKCFNMTFLKLIILDNEERHNNIQMFSFYHLINESCSTISGKTIFLNQKCQAFLCTHKLLTIDNDLYIGYYDINGKFHEKENLNILEIIYNENNPMLLYPQSYRLGCRQCPLFTCCSTGCYSINRQMPNPQDKTKYTYGNIANEFYCNFNLFLFQVCTELINEIEKDKNELFKNYLYGCSVKGLKGI